MQKIQGFADPLGLDAGHRPCWSGKHNSLRFNNLLYDPLKLRGYILYVDFIFSME